MSESKQQEQDELMEAEAAAAEAVESEEDAASAAEQALILEEHRIWKKNAPFLYDIVVSTPLEWPSLTVQWMPDREAPEGKDYTIQRLLLGTHTSPTEPEQPSPQNFLIIAELRLPGGNGKATSTAATASATKGSGRKAAAAQAAAQAAMDDGDEDEEGSYGAHSGKLEIVQQIPHAGEVHRARYAPHNPNLIATKSPSSKVYIFDKTKHASKPLDNTFRPDLVLAGHDAEGYGLAWNPHASCAGQLLSGSDDSKVCLWDVEAASREARSGSGANAAGVMPLSTFQGHTDVVEDVAWSHFVPTVFASCGDDARLLLWDTRTPQKPVSVINAGPARTSESGHHTGNINCVSFNHLSAHLLASGSSDRLVNLWDLRRLHAPVHALTGHTDVVFSVSFAPFSADIVASCGADRRTYVWDLARVGEPPMDGSEEDAADGPSELIFVHGGHCDRIADISWNPNVGEEWMMASVADDNVAQIWQMSDTIYTDDDEVTIVNGPPRRHIEEIE